MIGVARGTTTSKWDQTSVRPLVDGRFSVSSSLLRGKSGLQEIGWSYKKTSSSGIYADAGTSSFLSERNCTIDKWIFDFPICLSFLMQLRPLGTFWLRDTTTNDVTWCGCGINRKIVKTTSIKRNPKPPTKTRRGVIWFSCCMATLVILVRCTMQYLYWCNNAKNSLPTTRNEIHNL